MRKSAHSEERSDFPTACCGEKVHVSKEKLHFACCCLAVALRFVNNFELDEVGKFGAERAHIPMERCDFAWCLLRRKSVHSGCEKVHIPTETLDLLVACCGEKMHIARERLDFAWCLLVVCS